MAPTVVLESNNQPELFFKSHLRAQLRHPKLVKTAREAGPSGTTGPGLTLYAPRDVQFGRIASVLWCEVQQDRRNQLPDMRVEEDEATLHELSLVVRIVTQTNVVAYQAVAQTECCTGVHLQGTTADPSLSST